MPKATACAHVVEGPCYRSGSALTRGQSEPRTPFQNGGPGEELPLPSETPPPCLMTIPGPATSVRSPGKNSRRPALLHTASTISSFGYQGAAVNPVMAGLRCHESWLSIQLGEAEHRSQLAQERVLGVLGWAFFTCPARTRVIGFGFRAPSNLRGPIQLNFQRAKLRSIVARCLAPCLLNPHSWDTYPRHTPRG